ncbi:MAG: phospho-sugar mutase [Bacilli bacterium]
MNWRETFALYEEAATTNPELLVQLQSLQTEEDQQAHFDGALSFGTGGIRGILGIGPNRLNVWVVRKVCYSIAQQLRLEKSNAAVVIGYDARHQSRAFAEVAVATFSSFGIKAILFDNRSTTPEVSWAIRWYRADMGLMITASHNPPEYNGIKVYGSDGCQLAPHIADEIVTNMEQLPCEILLPTVAFSMKQCEVVSEQCTKEYVAAVSALSNLDINENIKVVYTPLHGVGLTRIQDVIGVKSWIDLHVVESQCNPDPDFTHTKSANPEDPISFTEAIALGEEIQGDVLLATDPDADRLGMAIHNGNQYVCLSGNEFAILAYYYLLKTKPLKRNATLIKSVVSTDTVDKMAQAVQMDVIHTLPGFKYIGERIGSFEEDDRSTFFFGFEESYGYLFSPFVRDKDAIQAALFACEMVSYFKRLGMNAIEVLHQIYETYGYSKEKLLNFSFPGYSGQEQMKEIMRHFRENGLPKSIAYSYVSDILEGKLRAPDGEFLGLTEWPNENMLIFHLKNNDSIILRPSGTEPKLKVYIKCTHAVEAEVGAVIEEIEQQITAQVARTLQTVNA